MRSIVSSARVSVVDVVRQGRKGRWRGGSIRQMAYAAKAAFLDRLRPLEEPTPDLPFWPPEQLVRRRLHTHTPE